MKVRFLLMLAACVCFPTGCVSQQRGAVCFTFDDYHGENWLKADPLFKKYNAHATFFIAGEITEEKAEVMKKLQKSGHAIGLHSLHHTRAVPFIHEQSENKYIKEEIKPQLNVCRKHGIEVHSFAYPFSRRDDDSDRMLFRYFDHIRGGRPAEKTFYYPLKELPEKCCFMGTGIGTKYGSELSVLKEEMTHAAETDSVLVYYSHNIGSAGEVGGIGMRIDLLEELLAHAKKLNLRIVGFDELKRLKTSRRIRSDRQ